MSGTDAAMEAALLAIAKDLLQASDDLAQTDPAASAKLAHEAYEIGRDLGIVRNHVDDAPDLSSVAASSADSEPVLTFERNGAGADADPARQASYGRRDSEDESDVDLFRILDRQKAMLPKPAELSPVLAPSRKSRPLNFESAPRRSGWFGWMRPREWRHAG